jgi:hypothetical protein
MRGCHCRGWTAVIASSVDAAGSTQPPPYDGVTDGGHDVSDRQPCGWYGFAFNSPAMVAVAGQ